MKASAAHMIGIVATVSSHNIMAPFGGAEGLIGNNPVGIAIRRITRLRWFSISR